MQPGILLAFFASRAAWHPPGSPGTYLQSCFTAYSGGAVAPRQVQDFALLLVEHPEVHVGPLLQAVKVALGGIMTLWCTSHSSQFRIINRLGEGTFCLIIQIINDDFEQDWTKY